MAKRKRIVWDDSASAAESARKKLPALVQSYFEEGRKLAEGEASQEALHRFRLRTKRLRYTLEFFRSCYGPGFETRLGALRKVQDYLGEISDCTATRQLAAAALPARTAERRQVERFLASRAQWKAAQFRRHWQKVFDVPGEDRRWRNYLSRVPAGTD